MSGNRTLIFASSNPNKISEINALIGKSYNVIGLADIGLLEEIPEPGSTIKENSFLKAQYVVEYLKKQGKNLPVFADDSGLEVEALNNEPGVYSARYAGIPKDDKANNAKLLKALQNITKRNARFVTVITLIIDGDVHYFEGEVQGTISYEGRGSNGFGYDPLFIPQGYRSTFAELSAEIKNSISHRGKAIQKLIAFLNSE
ncbi:MAG: RdgB/HAM1 family non-canonical purine NTP pyrophosphatase [Bacteroidia bacterium]|nr:RdgB/HAM1 family non-canonical purine NTP pyrophosphatase [Bacteroidia bacterium]